MKSSSAKSSKLSITTSESFLKAPPKFGLAVLAFFLPAPPVAVPPDLANLACLSALSLSLEMTFKVEMTCLIFSVDNSLVKSLIKSMAKEEE
ncbi:hypothetical protein WICPIJ_009252 [Wickerhamomyces pijperi]|uniref:Uncharacterized protein n=1 Tax=Wickerhamomyces pijperi TaxID=599730 RepID=A0A9P8TEG3_WICPI|nr:hypothetical protein WICPIJ_009252 [Wickerhamomyces pijperi]